MPKKDRDGATHIRDTETLQLLVDNIACLPYPVAGREMWIKHPYFNPMVARDRKNVVELKQRFCEAIVMLLEKHDRLKT